MRNGRNEREREGEGNKDERRRIGRKLKGEGDNGR